MPNAWPKEVLSDPCRFVRQLEQFAGLRSVGRGKPLWPPLGQAAPQALTGATPPWKLVAKWHGYSLTGTSPKE